jgi:glucosylceramidase
MKRAGVPINLLTIQNEPHFEPGDYPGMRMEPGERAAFIRGHLGPLMLSEIPQVKLLDWDHNWDQPDSPIAVLSDAKAARYIHGVAWHCYAGNVAAQSVVRDRFPDKETWFTECASGNWRKEWDKSFAWAVQTLIIGSTRNWAKGVVMWNLALDENHGPHLGGCGDCRGLVTIHSKTGAITREPEYYAFAHASKFVRAGAIRIASDSKDKDIETVAFQHGKGGEIVLIVRNGSPVERTVTFGTSSKSYKATLPGGAVATLKW